MRQMAQQPPFREEYQLCKNFGDPGSENYFERSTLPGQPRIDLNDAVGLTEYLRQEFCAPDLEKLAPHLWLMSTQSRSNISPLHRQLVKGREILIAEDPRLHLVWFYDRIFIKPLPMFILSYRFWTVYLLSDSSPLRARRSEISKAALGLLRTYHFLIKHESDFRIAQREDLQLIPRSITYAEFCALTSKFADINDFDVAARWSFGELRLSRLNVCSKIFLRQFHFEQLHGQYGSILAQFYGPLLFIFGMSSILLSGMQVELAVSQLTNSPWMVFARICRWFSILNIIGIAIIAMLLILLLIGMILDETVFAIKTRRKGAGLG